MLWAEVKTNLWCALLQYPEDCCLAQNVFRSLPSKLVVQCDKRLLHTLAGFPDGEAAAVGLRHLPVMKDTQTLCCCSGSICPSSPHLELAPILRDLQLLEGYPQTIWPQHCGQLDLCGP